MSAMIINSDRPSSVMMPMACPKNSVASPHGTTGKTVRSSRGTSWMIRCWSHGGGLWATKGFGIGRMRENRGFHKWLIVINSDYIYICIHGGFHTWRSPNSWLKRDNPMEDHPIVTVYEWDRPTDPYVSGMNIETIVWMLTPSYEYKIDNDIYM